jgi:hypothetical protein
MPVDVSGEPVVVLRSRIWPAVLAPAAVLVGSIAYGIWAQVFPTGFLPIIAAVLVVSALLFRGNEVLADDVGLLVRHRGRLIRSYRWDQIREAGLGYGSGIGWRGITVFPDGGPYDVPGPNSPTVVGKVWLWRTPADVRERIEAVLREHGVTVIGKRGRRTSDTDKGALPR